MLALFAAVAVFQSESPITRDAYGVPHIKAPTVADAFYHAGYACAQDRLWQMENSRRLARGRMAEVFGQQFVASDRDILSFGYTDSELDQQLASLSAESRRNFERYADGVNAWIKEAREKGSLPEGYKTHAFEPEPWSTTDSAAIAVRLFQQFGRGGAGEIRNMALLGYLQSREETKNRYLDVLDDFAWQNDPESIPTVPAKDDPLARNKPKFPVLTRTVTEKHLAMLPKVSLLELLPAIRIAMHEDSKLVAEQVNVPHKMGSYAVVVSPSRSANGRPILLSAPQMGHRSPSIVHEMSIEAPGLRVVGMDVPGVPGVVIGYTPQVAWALTSGVADTDDILYNKADGDGYSSGGAKKAIQTIVRELKVKGGSPVSVTQRRTEFGPILLHARGANVYFSRRSSYWMRELQSYEAVSGIYRASTPDEIESAVGKAPMSFNFFYATPRGDIGYRYVGAVPMRAEGLDPRFPTPGEPQYDWRGMVPFDQMPRVRNPKDGLLANWNNKPATWWPNFDTPVWGKVFRNSELLAALTDPKLTTQDVELAAWTIARRTAEWRYFAPYVQRIPDNYTPQPPATGSFGAGTVLPLVKAYDGWALEGSMGASAWNQYMDRLRRALFFRTTGNFISEDNFRLIAQPSVMLRALEGKTKVKYLEGADVPPQISALAAQPGELTRFQPGAINVPGQPPIPYSDRGTYIQIVELLQGGVTGRNVVSPGVAESGPHASDQAPLARQWTYKPMKSWPNP